MKIHWNLSKNERLVNTVVTVGTFDGVHQGHLAILNMLKKMSQELHAESVVVTFHPHPRHVIAPTDDPVKLINTIDERIAEFAKYGIDHLVIMPFTQTFSQLTPSAYIEDFLFDLFQPRALVVGFDHKFGHERKGDINLLKSYTEARNISVYTIDKKTEDDIKISSTFIRNAILKGNMQAANQRLGYPFYFSGKIEKGDGVGSSLGFPTANIAIEENHKILPLNGIYAALAYIQDQPIDGLLYIGTKATINEKKIPVIEIHLKDFSGDIYDQYIKVEVLQFIRGDQKFENKEELIEEIKNDDKKIASFLEIYKSSNS